MSIISSLSAASLSLDPVSDLRQLTAFPFMVNALEAGTVVAILAGVAGWFMVLRRESFAGHTLSVMAFPGATGAVLIGLPAAAGYFTFCGVSALVIGSSAGSGTDGTAARSPRSPEPFRRSVWRAGFCSSASTRVCSPAMRTCSSAISWASPAGRFCC